MSSRTLRLPRLILGFWAAWYSVIVASNVCDAMKWLAWLPTTWPFASGNLAAVHKTTAIYDLPAAASTALFALAVLWELAAAVLLMVAIAEQSSSESAWPSVERAMFVSIGLWGAFILADEIFIAFPTGIEGTHLRIFIAHLASLIAIALVARHETSARQ